MKRWTYFNVVFLLFCLVNCGSGSSVTIQIGFSGTDGPAALADRSVADIVFLITSLASEGQMLDLDRNGSPDVFVFPSKCDPSAPTGCGVSIASAGKFTIGELPFNFNYTIDVRFRGGSGQVLYGGSAQFTNDGTPQNVTIPITKVTP